MTLLALCNLHNVNSCYNFNKLTLNTHEITRIKKHISSSISSELLNLISSMLEIDPIHRVSLK